MIPTFPQRRGRRPRKLAGSHRRTVWVRAAAAGVATALACAGCSFGPKTAASPTNLRITGDFGATTVATKSLTIAKGGQNDLKALQAVAQVKTRPGTATTGPIVTSVNGSATEGSNHWFFYVNGVEPTEGPTAFTVNKGDHFWLDRHDAQAAARVPAVVGSFPEPFLNGLFGRRYPSTLECSPKMKTACDAINQQFTHFHIPLSPAAAGYGSGTDSLSINVGTWTQINDEVVAQLIARGASASGVYAHFTDDGTHLQLENAAGHLVRTLGPGAGLVAATTGPSDVPTWVVTGTDPAGVIAAARAMTASALAGKFALAVQGTSHYALPVDGNGG